MQIASNRSRGGHAHLRPLTTTHETYSLRSAGARICGLAVADSDTALSQRQVLDRLGLAGDEFAERIFARCGVQQRHLDLSSDFLSQTLQGRADQIDEQLMQRSIEAVDALEIDPQRIGSVFSSSLYSLGLPTLSHRLLEHYRMDPSTDKYHIDGVGCASAVPLLRLAAQSLHEHPDKQTLVVAADSLGGLLTRSRPEDPRAKVVGSAIFGDGCAAALLSRDPQAPGPVIVASQVHQIADTLDAVSLRLTGEDSYLHLARELPELAGEGLRDLLEGFLARNHVRRSQIEHWIVHPGGRRIIEQVGDALELNDAQLETSWQSLASHGNVGTPSILYVLSATIAARRPAPGERGLAVTIGPGVTIGLMLLQW